MTPDELDELQTWEGPPAYFLALTKAVEVARLALHAVRRPEDCVSVLFSVFTLNISNATCGRNPNLNSNPNCNSSGKRVVPMMWMSKPRSY